ncbi:HAD family hydrolase [Alloscardovia criceti]|uniref:HAD family hydrolase n=1 Tax=Alloscardovia criceti TaxID=356828 RepID=UPI00036C8C3C|nr:HAD family phosphatase [Alloscardovia criceti]
MILRGAIFDVDGTLLDSMSLWQTLPQRFLESLGLKPRPDVNQRCKDLSLAQSAEYFQRAYGVQLSSAEIEQAINTLLQQYYAQDVPAKPGAAEILKFARAQGLRLCIVSSTPSVLLRSALHRLDFVHYFDAILTSPDTGLHKDDARIFERAVERLGTRPAETIVFDDALYALRAAHTAGLRLAGVLDDSQSEDFEDIRALCDIVIAQNNYEETFRTFLEQ